jgi:16S rRNA (adenine1518-N6/adenine1519-N6)-dimethyltransferase
MSIKKLGQNFLTDINIAEREIEYCDINRKDTVLEIGPGTGILTKILSKKASSVIAVEIDKVLIKNLRNFLPDNVLLINDDILNINFEKLPKFNKIVSNLPYKISSPITFKLLNYDFSKAVLMYQKEFAERLIAKPGNKQYSRITVGIYYKVNCEILDIISKKCFYPQPKVDSCIVRLIPKKSKPLKLINEDFYFDLVRILFNNRRKKIKNILNKIYKKDISNLPYINKRVEELSPEEIACLSNNLTKIED